MPGTEIEQRPFNKALLTATIANFYPELKGAHMRRVHEEGQYNDAFVLNETFIFRFPRYQAGIEMMRREVSFLRAISGRTKLPVPNPIYAHLAAEEPGAVFMGYPLLPGQPLWRPAIRAETDGEVLDLWAQQLAGFLNELHALPAADFAASGPPADTLTDWQEMFDQIRANLFPLMRPDARSEVAAHFETYLDDPALHHFQPAPRHGDYGSGNILYDPATKSITGIIDFGFAALGDPALDIAAASTLGEPLFGRFATTYPALDSLLPRAHFYRGTYALDEALHGFQSGDQEAFTAGMAQYV